MLLVLLAIAYIIGYTVLMNAWPTRCPACRRVNVFRRAPTGPRQDELDDERIVRRISTEVACGRCGRRYWLGWDDFAGREATFFSPPSAARSREP
jgi:hypothetical protein